MSESLLEALMQLFALLTDLQPGDKAEKARTWVETFLRRSYSGEYIHQYMSRYDVYLSSLQHENSVAHGSQSREDKDRDEARRYLKMLDICRHITLEMEEEPRIILLGLLMNFLQGEEEITDDEKSFIGTVARELQINENDFQHLSTFILGKPYEVNDRSALLLIAGEAHPEYADVKQIVNDRQQVMIWVLHIRSTNSFFFRYNGSRNLYMNGNKVEQDKAYVLNAGSVIKTSMMPPVYYGTIAEKFFQREDKGRIVYRAIDVEYKFNNDQIGIHQFSFAGRSGQLVAVMGGSGSGKSTLLNVLNGNYKLSHGRIFVNGYDLHNEHAHLEGVIGFVPQDDMLIEEFTVFENLYYNARLCFSHLSEEEITKLVERALNDFDLVEARDLVVGNPLRKVLSGGQRKRLNIALELIREPSILFVDEPTSGLSSMDSEKVIVLLKRQTLKGRLVIINIHQPSSDLYKLIDKLLIIDRGGHIIYSGNPMDAIVYFKQQANYVNAEERECQSCGNVKTEQPLRIIEARMVSPSGKPIRKRKVKPEEWYQLYLDNFESKFDWKHRKVSQKKDALPPNLYNIPGRIKQFKIFVMRDVLKKIKDKQYLLINLLEAPLLAIILGFFTKYVAGTATDPNAYVFSENTNLPAYLFMSVVVAIFLGLNVSAEEIIKDRKLLKREKFLNLSRFSYLISKISILFTISAIQTLSFVLIGNAILEIEGMNLAYWGILFSTACFANLVGLNVSSGLNSVVSIYILIPVILIPQLLFSGVIVNFDKLHKSIASEEYVPRMGDLMTSRWAYEALAVNQFVNNRFERKIFRYEMGMSRSNFYAGTLIPQLMKQNEQCVSDFYDNDAGSLEVGFSVLRTELKRIQADWIQFHQMLDLKDVIYTPETYARIKEMLEKCKAELNEYYNHQRELKDEKIASLTQSLGSNEAMLEFKQKHYNEALATQLLKRNELRQIEFTGKRYIQKRHPIFQTPLSNWGRAHFYAPVKRLAGMTIPTAWFNVMVIWFGTAIFYVTLYFDLLRKLLHVFEKFRLKQIQKQLQKISG
ncbi:MAG: ATP-binding cassette domain-containing protein [Marinilabiliaceae bacterium]|nr:ATP-binding cassette domain-containing protein [Marinilabiliaceae bacterium]